MTARRESASYRLPRRYSRIWRAGRQRGLFTCRWSRVSQEAGGLSEPHSFSAFGGPEFLVDVLHMRLDGGTADAELGADRSERSVRGEERQDARLGRRQGNRRAGRFRAAGVQLAGNGPRTIDRGSSVRHRPKWLVSRIRGCRSSRPRARAQPGRWPPGRVCRRHDDKVVVDPPGDPLRSTSKPELCSAFAGQ